jgi:heme A synthase
MILKSHLISMIVYSVFVCAVLAIIRRRERKAQIRYFISLFLIMVVGALLFGWFMYLFIP